MKKCNICKILQLKDNFNKNKGRKDGLSHRCRECNKVIQKKYYRQNRNQYYVRNKKSKKKIIDYIKKAKDKPCADCNKKFPYYIMDFHHLRNKKFIIAHGMHVAGFEKIKKEIVKCDVVCVNCHRERTYGNNIEK